MTKPKKYNRRQALFLARFIEHAAWHRARVEEADGALTFSLRVLTLRVAALLAARDDKAAHRALMGGRSIRSVRATEQRFRSALRDAIGGVIDEAFAAPRPARGVK